ncbi:MAG: hypothetical protein ACYTG7_22610 [Planctomycetota bacterium]|jgi:hypothetical protein
MYGLLLRTLEEDDLVGVFTLRRIELLVRGEYALVAEDLVEGFTELLERFTGLDRVDLDDVVLFAGEALEREEVVLRELAREPDREEDCCPFTDCLELLEDDFARPVRDWASASATNQHKARVMANNNMILRHMVIPPTGKERRAPTKRSWSTDRCIDYSLFWRQNLQKRNFDCKSLNR